MKYLMVCSLAALFIALARMKPAEKENTAFTGFAVVELFTSEGCSSCPPADEAIARLGKENPNVLILGFHVDYWDRLGWKDPFSSSAWSDRQKEYAGRLKLSSIYTPQAVVNGVTEFTGSDDARLHSAVSNALAKKAAVSIQLTAAKINGHAVSFSYQVPGSTTGVLQCALVQRNAETSVRRGENEGKTLHHINIVRDFKSIPLTNNTGNSKLALPAGLAAADLQLIVFVQDKNTGQILGATQSAIE